VLDERSDGRSHRHGIGLRPWRTTALGRLTERVETGVVFDFAGPMDGGEALYATTSASLLQIALMKGSVTPPSDGSTISEYSTRPKDPNSRRTDSAS